MCSWNYEAPKLICLLSLYWAILVSLKMAQKGFISDCDDIDTKSKNHRDDASNLFTAALNAFQPFRKFACMLRSWSSIREKMHICAMAVRKLEVGSEIRGNFAILSPLLSKGRRCEFLQGFLKISLKRGIRVELQRCSTNMNIKGRSRIRISRIYSDRGQTVWSCHPQFREDFKKYNLQKRTISPEKYFNALQVGNNALKLKHVWSFTNWIPILNPESKWAPTTLPAFDRHFGLGLQIERIPMLLKDLSPFVCFHVLFSSQKLVHNFYLWMKFITCRFPETC